MASRCIRKASLLCGVLLFASSIVLTQAATPKTVHLKNPYDPNNPDNYDDNPYLDPTLAHSIPDSKEDTGSAGMHDPNGQPISTSANAATAKASRVPVFTILAMTCFMSAMAGFGAVPFFFCGKLKKSWAGLANAVACGVMLAASFDLLHEGAPYSPTLTITGMVLGGIFIKTSQEWLAQFEDAAFEELSGADARKAMLIVGVMAAHAFGEGSGVGVSFSGQRGWAQGTLVTIAIGLHNIPEGMAVATVMVSKGAPPRKALFWSLFCAFPQALVAVPSYLFVETFQSLLPLALGFAAGCMIWILTAELMPDALESAPHPHVATAVTLSAAWLQGLSMMIATLERPDGALSWPIKADSGVLVAITVCLIPALMAVVLAAAVGAPALATLPTALGATAGVLGAAGLSCLGWLVLAGELTVMHTLLWAGVGAGISVLLWRNVLRPAAPEVRRSLDGQLKEAQRNNTGIGKHPPAHAEQPHDEQAVVVHSQYGESGAAYMRAGNGTMAAAGAGKPAQWQQEHGALSGYSHENGHAGPPPMQNGWHGSPAHAPNGHMYVAPGAMHALQDGSGPYANGNHLHGSMGGVPNGAHGVTMQPLHASPFHAQAHENGGRWAEVHLDPGQKHPDMGAGYAGHDTGLTRRPSIGYHHHHHAADPQQEAEGIQKLGLGLPSAGGVGQQGLGMRAALQGAVLLCCHAGCSTGLQVAAAMAAHGSEVKAGGTGVATLFAHWLLPLTLQGLPLGLACVGVGKALGGAGRWPAVWVSLATTLCVILGALIGAGGLPLGQSGAVFAHWDNGWSGALRAATAGALIAGAALHVWPAAAASKKQRAQTGAVLGVLVCWCCQLLAGGLCSATPYCMR